jgi:hypothetical protein
MVVAVEVDASTLGAVSGQSAQVSRTGRAKAR